MDKYVVHHADSLSGSVSVSGSKNAALPILAAVLLTQEPCTITNLPPLSDVKSMLCLLQEAGLAYQYDETKETLQTNGWKCNFDLSQSQAAGKLRASFLVAGALLSTCKEAVLPMPGGCPIGSRPIDLHLKGFRKLGAKVDVSGGIVTLRAKELKGTAIYLDFPSVGATENILLAAVSAKGKTVLENAAAEPEIVDLVRFLRKMGAHISGEGTATITIEGKSALCGAVHQIMPDRIEAGTLLIAGAITGGDILIKGASVEDLGPVIAKLRECNVKIEEVAEGIHLTRKGRLRPVDLKTMPHPGFPTDLQAPFMSLLAVAKGTSVVTETVFENRFLHVGELRRMGADIRIDSRSAVVEGVEEMKGAKVEATDLRAGAALMLAALAAKGDTEIGDLGHIRRGYDHLEEKLCQLGAKIEKTEE